MSWLIDHSGRPDCVRIETRGRTHYIPVARFDNRSDKTTFVRTAQSKWPADKIAALHSGLAEALARLAGMERESVG